MTITLACGTCKIFGKSMGRTWGEEIMITYRCEGKEIETYVPHWLNWITEWKKRESSFYHITIRWYFNKKFLCLLCSIKFGSQILFFSGKIVWNVRGWFEVPIVGWWTTFRDWKRLKKPRNYIVFGLPCILLNIFTFTSIKVWIYIWGA